MQYQKTKGSPCYSGEYRQAFIRLTHRAYFLRQLIFQIFIPQPLFLFGKMHLAELLRVILIAELLVTELLAGQIEYAAVHDVVTMIIPAFARHAVNLASENILREKSRNRALSERAVVLAPICTKSGGAGVFAPDFAQNVIQITRSHAVGSFDIGRLPAVEIVLFHDFT